MSKKIIIKDIAGKHEAITCEVELPLSARIDEVKNILQREFPGSPVPSSQRLICGGKVLRDPQTLGECLSRGNNANTIYLVVAEDRNPSRPSSSAATPASKTGATATTTRHAPQQGIGSVASSSAQGLRAEQVSTTHHAAESRSQPPVQREALAAQREGHAADVNAAAQPAAPAAAPAAAPPAAGVNPGNGGWSLLFKLLLVVFLLSQNGSSINLYVLGAIAFLIFIWQTGRLEMILRSLSVYIPGLRRNRLLRDGSSEDENRTSSSWLSYYGMFMYCFVLAFLFSLYPPWKPEAMVPRPPARREIAADADEHPHND
mmetsp:Transcript_10651/g.32614  ORF Transcript_10651/g.32614 Transcript_10651/m.32614 type:complete len:317 (+) Transcript_10651:102-1052(+)|eukprot:CAMPEP_0198736696 /NCGR_PEP_ID=MMETSP1475-20131203/67488_1 /TAXON_ID= ORGANISM="Unidentified sp., Strain CCMP1999" /NCGR_SAMPLE_ID=MMETSP1475 /ASSEMBLY_ACC=CAM_ASM_001111 /LENGTH=316 /DNA_ID=CAMNT_0044500545 /DNA_START=80 /DNA_END=1030 /DNA_ORIENTATION=-